MERSLSINKTSYKRLSIDIILFAVSCVNKYALIAWMLYYSIWTLFSNKTIFSRNKRIVVFLILLQLRSIINPGIAVSISEAGIVKWLCVFGLSLYLLLSCRRYLNKGMRRLQIRFAFFGVYLIIAALIKSSYPLVATFKAVSYILPFTAILDGIYVTRSYRWIKKINILLGSLILGSAFVLSLPVGYLRNGIFFQGLFNHPNVFAVMIAIFMAGYLYDKNQKKKTIFDWTIIILCAFFIYRSFSRTGALSFALILIIDIFSSNRKKINKLLSFALIVIVAGVLVSFSSTWQNEIRNFFYKGGNSFSEITASRHGQIENNLSRFNSSPFLGTGFNVPYNPDIYSFMFSFDLVTENGNLALAILGDMGIIGALIFIYCYGMIFRLGKGNPWGYTIFWAPFLVSMGEMAFFSTNNFAIILYMFFGIFIADKTKSAEGEGSEI